MSFSHGPFRFCPRICISHSRQPNKIHRISHFPFSDDNKPWARHQLFLDFNSLSTWSDDSDPTMPSHPHTIQPDIDLHFVCFLCHLWSTPAPWSRRFLSRLHLRQLVPTDEFCNSGFSLDHYNCPVTIQQLITPLTSSNNSALRPPNSDFQTFIDFQTNRTRSPLDSWTSLSPWHVKSWLDFSVAPWSLLWHCNFCQISL